MRLISAWANNGRGGRRRVEAAGDSHHLTKQINKIQWLPLPLSCTTNNRCIFSGVSCLLLTFYPNIRTSVGLKLLKVVKRRIWSKTQEWNRITCAKWLVIRLKHTHPPSLAAISPPPPPLFSTWPLFHFACTNRSCFPRNSITSNDGAITAVAAPATDSSPGDIDD